MDDTELAGQHFARALSDFLASDAHESTARDGVEEWLRGSYRALVDVALASTRSTDPQGRDALVSAMHTLHRSVTWEARKAWEERERKERDRQREREEAEARARAAEEKARAEEAARREEQARREKERERRRAQEDREQAAREAAALRRKRKEALRARTEELWTTGPRPWSTSLELPRHDTHRVDVPGKRSAEDGLLLRGLRVDGLRLPENQRRELYEELAGHTDPAVQQTEGGSACCVLPPLGGLPGVGTVSREARPGMEQRELVAVLREQAEALTEVVEEAAAGAAGLRWLAVARLDLEVSAEAVGEWRGQVRHRLERVEDAVGDKTLAQEAVLLDRQLSEMVLDPVPGPGSWWLEERESRQRTVASLLRTDGCASMAKAKVNEHDRRTLIGSDSVVSQRRAGNRVLWWISLPWRNGSGEITPGRCVIEIESA